MLLRPGLAASSADSREDASAGEAPVCMNEKRHRDSSQSCMVQPGFGAPLSRKAGVPFALHEPARMRASKDRLTTMTGHLRYQAIQHPPVTHAEALC